MHITVDKELLTDGCTNILSVDYSIANNDAHSTTGSVTIISVIIWTKLNNCNSGIRILSLRDLSEGYQTSSSILQAPRTRTRLSYYCHRGAWTGVAKPVPAFDTHCGVQTGVAKCVLAFDGLCRARTGVAKTCNSLRQSQRGSNGGRQMCKPFLTVSAELERELENVY